VSGNKHEKVLSPVNGMHMITNMRSEMAKFMIRMFVVDRIRGLKATTEPKWRKTRRKFPSELFVASAERVLLTDYNQSISYQARHEDKSKEDEHGELNNPLKILVKKWHINFCVVLGTA
jgi:hypothetical protein